MQPFQQVYEEYYEMVDRFLLRLCRNQALAEEMCQETFYQVLKGWKRYRGEGKISTWLCTIAKRTYFETMRKTRPVPLEAARDETDVSELLVQSDRMMTAQKALHALPEPYREVFTLRTFCDLSHAQIGALFGKTDGWARVIYYRARQMLRQEMEDQHEG